MLEIEPLFMRSAGDGKPGTYLQYMCSFQQLRKLWPRLIECYGHLRRDHEAMSGHASLVRSAYICSSVVTEKNVFTVRFDLNL
jgi:hypothetical protein